MVSLRFIGRGAAGSGLAAEFIRASSVGRLCPLCVRLGKCLRKSASGRMSAAGQRHRNALHFHRSLGAITELDRQLERASIARQGCARPQILEIYHVAGTAYWLSYQRALMAAFYALASTFGSIEDGLGRDPGGLVWRIPSRSPDTAVSSAASSSPSRG